MNYLSTLTFLLLTSSLFAQTSTYQPSMGAGYSNQTFFKLSNGNTKTLAHSTWHIAFSTLGSTDAGIFINEESVSLYATNITDFGTSINYPSDATGELANAEISWSYGAFNENRVVSNPFDYGWGTYSTSSHIISGSKVYILEISTGVYKKIIIDSLVSGTYHFRYADLDGSNSQAKTVQKSDHSDSQLAYFSLTTGDPVANAEPAEWDLTFATYNTLIPNPSTGGFINYTVRGVLTAAGVKVAKAVGDTSTLDGNDYTDSLSMDSLKIIGHTWKGLNGFSYYVKDDRVYFIKTTDDNYWKLRFVDFTGSSAGTTTLQVTSLGAISKVNEVNSTESIAFSTFPNPTNGAFEVVLDLPHPQKAVQLVLYNQLGQPVYQQNYTALNGFQQIAVPNLNLAAGTYILRLEGKNIAIARKIQIH